MNQNDEDLDENGSNDEALPLDMLDEDLDFFAMPNNNKRKRSNKKKEDEDDDDAIERNYKLNLNLLSKNLDFNGQKKKLLPIKTDRGLVQQFMDVDRQKDKKKAKKDEPVAVKNEEKLKSGEQLKNGGAIIGFIEDDTETKSLAEIIFEKKQNIEITKLKIASLSKAIVSDPQQETKKLKELRQMLILPNVHKEIILKKILIVSLTEIFKDIAPGYKIRVWSEKENEQQHTKDTETLRGYEETLIKQYKLFIDHLNESVRFLNKGVNESEISFGILTVQCLCDLLERLSHFNYRKEIMEAVVKQMGSKNPQAAKLACSCVERLFQADKELEISLEITRCVAKLLKQRSYGVKAEVMNTFLALNLKEIKIIEEDNNKMTHREKMKLSRSERKNLKEKERIDKDLGQQKLEDKLKTKSKFQGHILEQIFLVYFNILKKSPNYKLIPCVLEGLAKFAQLINLDFFDDLVAVMHGMIESNKLNYKSKLHCIKTVFIVLSGQGEALTIDPLRFYTSLYNIILSIGIVCNDEDILLLDECLDMMFLKRKKQIPNARLLAFIKRLSTVALQCEAKGCAVILHVLKKLISINKASELLFDAEYQDSGIYLPELKEPDYVNAQNTALWELHLLSRHYDSSVREKSVDLIKQRELTFVELKRTASQVYEDVNKNAVDFFKNANNLAVKAKNNNNNKKLKK